MGCRMLSEYAHLHLLRCGVIIMTKLKLFLITVIFTVLLVFQSGCYTVVRWSKLRGISNDIQYTVFNHASIINEDLSESITKHHTDTTTTKKQRNTVLYSIRRNSDTSASNSNVGSNATKPKISEKSLSSSTGNSRRK